MKVLEALDYIVQLNEAHKFLTDEPLKEIEVHPDVYDQLKAELRRLSFRIYMEGYFFWTFDRSVLVYDGTHIRKRESKPKTQPHYMYGGEVHDEWESYGHR